MLNGILLLGLAYALWDTWATLRGWMLAQRYPLVISLLEALFIGVLCYYDAGVHSPFRYYYLLSLIICALRYEPVVTYVTLACTVRVSACCIWHAPGARKMPESCCWVWC
jgi:two-component system NtrC family sensor kinase